MTRRRTAICQLTVKEKCRPIPATQTQMEGGITHFRSWYPTINPQNLDESSRVSWRCNSETIWLQVRQKPQYDLQRRIAEIIEWYKANKWR